MDTKKLHEELLEIAKRLIEIADLLHGQQEANNAAESDDSGTNPPGDPPPHPPGTGH